jgi:hypothetical protein
VRIRTFISASRPLQFPLRPEIDARAKAFARLIDLAMVVCQLLKTPRRASFACRYRQRVAFQAISDQDQA